MLDAQINALLDDLLGDFGIGENEHRLRLLGNSFQIRIARSTIKSRQVRVDREDGIAGLLELTIAEIAAGLAFIRYTDHSDLFLSEEVVYERINLGRENAPFR